MDAAPRTPRTDADGIAARYGLTPRAVTAWTGLPNFPRPEADGQWPVAKVDAWMAANRPQITRRDADSEEAAAPPAPAASPRAGSGLGELAERYNVTDQTMRRWAGDAAFPAPAQDRWDTEDVDTWVRAYRPHAWTAATKTDPDWVIPPPEGDAKDLLDIGTFGELLGNATRGTPIPRPTMNSYRRQGHLPEPDRTPGDKKRPRVFENMWFRETAMAHLRTRRRARRREA